MKTYTQTPSFGFFDLKTEAKTLSILHNKQKYSPQFRHQFTLNNNKNDFFSKLEPIVA
jgi:hypothetical protein